MSVPTSHDLFRGRHRGQPSQAQVEPRHPVLLLGEIKPSEHRKIGFERLVERGLGWRIRDTVLCVEHQIREGTGSCEDFLRSRTVASQLS
jgi:hypothetical protein